MHDTVVFLGPSMPVEEARRLLDAEFVPPICRGDLALLPSNVRIIGIIDGEFFQKLAVSPKEIIEALGRGVRVFGSSSMGALRAAETHTFGMDASLSSFAMGFSMRTTRSRSLMSRARTERFRTQWLISARH